MSPLRRKRERGPELPADAGTTNRNDEAPPPEPSQAPETPEKRSGLMEAMKAALREAALRRTSTKR